MDIEKRLERLEHRLRIAEDRAEILELLAVYGPLVDSGMANEAAALWAEGGGYGFTNPANGAPLRIEAPDALVGMYRSQAHLDMINGGCGHFLGLPNLAIDGDRAEAVGYTFVARRDSDHWTVWRAAVNHWILHRTDGGWRISERVNQALDGSQESQALMRKVAHFGQTAKS